MSYSTEWIPGLFFFGFVALFWVPPVALIGLTLFLLAAVAAIVATPFLLGRYILRRLRARRPVEREDHVAERHEASVAVVAG
jgi:hypothetical protein